MATETESTFKIGSVSLYSKSWTPSSIPAKAKLLVIHGYSDHMNRYYELFPTLASRGISVYGIDQRGWGRSVTSPSERGNCGPTSLVISDIAAFISSHLPSEIPVFVLGHSMGGGEAITLASDSQYESIVKQIRGWLLEAPFVGFPKGYEPSSLKIFFGRLAGRFLPHRQLYNPIPKENVTRDPAVVRDLIADKLCHDTGTLEALAGLLDRTAALYEGRTTLSPSVRSLWVGHGTDDKGTSYQESKKWFEKENVKDKEFKTYEGWSHLLHGDLPDNRDVFAKDVGDWILKRVDGGVDKQSKL
ncbi:Acylglycerol lipase/Carboxylesterase [Chlorociboria aeruginascens]|nr:Acylglycerol lipase/Carboxylesterase [Chlorociboria aeruginascens]